MEVNNKLPFRKAKWCKKCGSDVVLHSNCTLSYECISVYRIGKRNEDVQDEWLSVTCNRCNYTWKEQVAND